jgi:hypothetical protein
MKHLKQTDYNISIAKRLKINVDFLEKRDNIAIVSNDNCPRILQILI